VKNQLTAGLVLVMAITIAAMAFFFVKQGHEINRLENDLNAVKALGASQTNPAASLPSTSSSSLTMVDLIHLIQPVIVRIDVVGAGFQASGSGIIVRKDGSVITNAHVVEGANAITVTLSTGKQYSAALNSSDANLDLAVVKLSGLLAICRLRLWGLRAISWWAGQ
jgi:S1-C subfamily serine protease